MERILIVDDEQGIRDVMTLFLEDLGYEVLTAETGEEAIKVVEKERPPLVLLDMTLPGMNGMATLQKLLALDKHIGVVMATGQIDEKLAKESIQLGAYDYVLKPFDLKHLELVVKTRLLMTDGKKAADD